MAFSLGRFNSPPSNQTPSNNFNRQFVNNQDQFSQKVQLQNRALAKKNSILMTKITDLETKISELIQHNIELRALNAKKEDEKNKWLEEKLTLIEEGIGQRFEEMFQMLSTIRSNEGLSQSKIRLAGLIGNSSTDLSSDKTVSFNNVKSPKKQKASKSVRRRKSARRQSIYIPPPASPIINENATLGQRTSDFEIFDHYKGHLQSKSEGAPELQQYEQEQPPNEDSFQLPENFDSSENPFQETVDPSVLETLAFEKAETRSQQEENEEEEGDLCVRKREREVDEFSHASSLSPIRFSSPKLEESQKSKFLVYDDSNDKQAHNNEELEKKVKRLAFESVKIIDVSDDDNRGEEEVEKSELSDEQKPLIRNDNKVKHTQAKSKRSKSSDDEQMPEAADPVLSTRKSRTRGKAVSYAEPSLRAKMRRQSEKYVGAVEGERQQNFIRPETTQAATVIDSSSVSIQPTQTAESKSIKTVDVSSNRVPSGTTPTYDVSEPAQKAQQEEQIKLVPLTLQDNANITKRRKPLSNVTSNQNKIQKASSKPMKKFELDDDSDLSVFDLVEEKAVGVPSKTYKGNPDIKPKRRSSKRHSMIF